MSKAIDRKKWEAIVTGSPALRKAICKDDEFGALYFAMYYFTEYFSFRTPDFHMDMYLDCKHLTDGTLDEAMWCVFRDGAKTSIAKIALLTWCICFQKKSYIGWDSYDGENAESALFDVTVALQTNKKLIADFGHLYYKKQSKTALSEAKMKRIKNFITEPSQYGPGVKVVTFSTQEAIRGRITGHERLDLVIFDDFENNKTKDSAPITSKIIKHIDEYRSGMPAGASVLYLCNYIIDTGSVAHIMENLKDNPRAIVRFIPVKNAKGEIAWPDKFVDTRAEADELNKDIPNQKLHKVSLEAKREALSKDGLTYETEMMLNPAKSGDLFFDRVKVDVALSKATEPIDVSADLKIWAKFNPKHRYGGGADTAEGVGGDHNASCWIDFTQTPNLLVASFQDNQMSNTTFGWELKRQGALYSYPYLVPEINNTGYGTVAELINAEYPNIYQREVKNKVTGKVQKEYGWRATIGTKFDVLGKFKEAFESGELDILDKGLLEEMRVFTKAAARVIGREKDATRHYDKLRACALAWEAQKFAPLPTDDKKKLFTVPGQDQPYRP
jgi:hypothetical protein